MIKDRKSHNSNIKDNKKGKSVELEDNSKMKLDSNNDSNKHIKSNKKSRKNTFNLIEVIIIMVITVLFGLLVGSFITYISNDRDVNCSSIRKDMTEFTQVYDDLLNEYSGDINKDELFRVAIKAMIESLNDPYSVYMSAEEAKIYDEELNGEFVGLGTVIISYDGALPEVIEVYKDSPASKAGLMVGDVFLKVDEQDLNGLTTDEISKIIKSKKKGTTIKLVVLRNNEAIEFEFVTDTVQVDSVSGYVESKNDKKVGVIKISSFAKNTSKQFKEVYNELKEENITGLIIDVRDNNGGYLSVAKDIASLFLDKDMTIYQKETDGEIEKFISETEKEIDLPVVFIVNVGTASASEVLVTALSENLGVDVVGTSTYGKGSIQKLYSLSDGSYIKYTVQSWLTPKGNSVAPFGIEPTRVVYLNEEYFQNQTNENDNQLQEALNLLLG